MFAGTGAPAPRGAEAMAEQPIHEVELWDLVSAFGRILRDRQAQTPSNIVYDEAGTVYCYDRVSQPMVRHPMAYIGYEPDRIVNDYMKRYDAATNPLKK